jgi:hypothetical protein
MMRRLGFSTRYDAAPSFLTGPKLLRLVHALFPPKYGVGAGGAAAGLPRPARLRKFINTDHTGDGGFRRSFV